MGFVQALSVLVQVFISYSGRKDRNNIQRLLTFVENTEDARQLGAILVLQQIGGSPSKITAQVRKAAEEAMRRLLPLTQISDLNALNTQQRACLRRGLFHRGSNTASDYWPDTDYCILVLSALEQVGDKRDLPDMERLLKEYYVTDKVRAAAERCMQTITERIARENLKDVLLRPDRNPDAPATLLRPSAERANSAPQQLLRASASSDTEQLP